MNVTRLAIPDVVLIEPQVFFDDRGFFFESFNEEKFAKATGISIHFAQDNHSESVKDVLRGLHYQVPPMAQGKLVRVIEGEIFDVAVDIRKDSPTFGKYVSEILSAENKKQLWIPEGFAHGFLTLSAKAQVLYKTTRIYSKMHERSICWNDKSLGILWPNRAPLLSDKDAVAQGLINE